MSDGSVSPDGVMDRRRRRSRRIHTRRRGCASGPLAGLVGAPNATGASGGATSAPPAMTGIRPSSRVRGARFEHVFEPRPGKRSNRSRVAGRIPMRYPKNPRFLDLNRARRCARHKTIDSYRSHVRHASSPPRRRLWRAIELDRTEPQRRSMQVRSREKHDGHRRDPPRHGCQSRSSRVSLRTSRRRLQLLEIPAARGFATSEARRGTRVAKGSGTGPS